MDLAGLIWKGPGCGERGRREDRRRDAHRREALLSLQPAGGPTGVGDPSGQAYWQAGKSVAHIDRIEPAGDIIRRFRAAVSETS